MYIDGAAICAAVRIRCGGIEASVDRTRIARLRVGNDDDDVGTMNDATDEQTTGNVSMQHASLVERMLADCGALRSLTCDTNTRIDRHRGLLERCAFMVARARAPPPQLVSAVTPPSSSSSSSIEAALQPVCVGSEWRAARALDASSAIESALAPLAGIFFC